MRLLCPFDAFHRAQIQIELEGLQWLGTKHVLVAKSQVDPNTMSSNRGRTWGR
jgi:hypothetical protein